MALTKSDYLHHLQALLPQGSAWPVDDEAALTRLLHAWADELERVDVRAGQLLQEYGYENIQSACSYVNSENRTFAAEAKACTRWRDNVWETCHTIFNKIAAETMLVPSEKEFILMLPQIKWPEPKTGFSRLMASVFG